MANPYKSYLFFPSAVLWLIANQCVLRYLSPKTSLLEATLASLGIYLIDNQMILKWVLVPIPQTPSTLMITPPSILMRSGYIGKK